MFELIFLVLMIVVFGKIFLFALKAAWGIGKIVFSVILIPFILVAMVLSGLMYLAFLILIVVGIVSLVCLGK